MPILFRDYETRSAFNLKAVGAWKYSVDPTTDVWCFAHAVDDGPVNLWRPGDPIPPEWIEAANNPDWLVSAYNDQFERLIEQHIMAPRYGWPLVPIERHRCTQAASLAHALPPKLENVAKALNLAQQKDMAGHKVMMKLAKPRKPRKEEDPGGIYWHEYDPQLGAYCKQDVETERALYRRVGHLSGEEQALWLLDAKINDRGVYLDGDLLAAAGKITDQARAEIAAEIGEITGGEVTSINQCEKLQTWLEAHGCTITNVQKETLRRALTPKGLSDEVRHVLGLRRDGAHMDKLDSMRNWRGTDGRARGALKFHGASTGRWTSHGIQLQNMKRPAVEDMGAAIDAVSTGSLAHVRDHYLQPLSAVGDLARAMLCAAPGHRFIAADFSGIESRVTAWISGQQSKIDQWAKFDRTQNPGDEPYFITGTLIFGLRPEVAREPGKTGDLAFGYMGGPGAWKKLAPPDDTSTEAEIKQRQRAWRNAHPQTVKFWGTINRAAIQAVRKPGVVIECGHLAFKSDGTFLRMKLPNGRKLTYPFPRLKANDRGDLTVTFMDTQQGKWTECRHGHGAYGGIWIENAVQAVARDLFAAAMPRLEAAGYPIVLHVHDEIVAEAPDGFGSEEEFKALLLTLPPWAMDLPLNAKTRNGPRFCKIKSTTEAPPIQPEIGILGVAEVPSDANERVSELPNSSDPEHNPPHDANPPPDDPPPDSPPPRGNGGSKAEAERDTFAEDHAGEPFNDAFLRRKGYQLAHVFDYTLADSALLYQQNRYELKGGIAPTKERPRKKFLPHRSVNGKNILGAGDRRVIYNWPAIMRAGPGSTVFAPEGENKAKALIDAGLLATTVISHKWTPECVAALTGYHLIILADHDKDGEKLAGDAQRKLAPVAASTRIVPAPHLWKHLPGGKEPKPGDDVVDWIKLGGDPKKLIDICREIPADGIITAEPYQFREEADIAAWQWLYGQHLLRGEVSGTAAMGGTGKSTLSIVEALAMASGRALVCEASATPLRVVLINLEDTRNTMDKRITAVMRQYGLTPADIGDRLIVKAKGEIKIKVARQLRSGDVERNEQVIQALVKLMLGHRADVLSIDSFIRTHRVNENDNSAVQEVVECFEDIATVAQCSVHLWHHTRKSGGERVTIETTRGAIAFVDACRSARVLETMPTKEHAELIEVQPEMLPAGFYFRAFNGKRNFAPPADQSDWYKLESVLLRNGDNVGVATAWQYPASFADLSAEVINHILDDINAGLPNGQRYSNHNSATERAAWSIVQQHCPDKTRSQCRQIITTWMSNGMLFEDKYDDPVQRKPAKGLYVRSAKRPGKQEV